MVVVVERLFPINQTSNIPEFLDMTRDGDCSLLIKPVFFLRLLQQLHEQRVIEVHHRHHEPLFLFSLTHLHCHTPFWHAGLLLLPLAMVVVAMQIEPLESTLLPTTHLCN